MIKNECKIIRDLLPNYIENQISHETKEFVDAHMKNCKNCKEIFNSISDKQEIVPDDKEVDFLKKYNNKMAILKVFAAILSVIILFMWIILGLNYVKKQKNYKRAEYIYNIIDKSYNRIAQIENGNNYIRTEKSSPYNFEITFQYKDGYFKEEHNNSVGFDFTNYGINLGDKSVYIQYIGNNYGSIATETHVTDKNALASYHNKDISDYINCDIYVGSDYYVIDCPNKDGSVTEMWISRVSMLLFKKFITTFDGTVDYECEYNWCANRVTDDDVRIKDENANAKLQEYVEKIKNMDR